MAESLFGLFFSFYTIFSPVQNGDQLRHRGEAFVEWSCNPEVWDSSSGMIKDQFVGTVTALCQFTATNGGGFAQLNRHLNERITTSPEVEKIYSGPVPEMYEGLTSAAYDITARLGEGSDVAHIRSDYHIATDEQSRLVFATLSKQISGSGNTKYVKKTDVIAEVLPKANQNGDYTIQLKAHAVLDRPWFLPSGTFENLIRDQVKKQAQKTEAALIQELAANL